ncbi:MAG: hypothetical protein ACF8AM_10600 [Rhodopirellula sp. JB055]|uniref:hypothetical protein n=1 Tax=Rhodopirellula sp. JB055 TaxID=3342846 RepID=UPI00370A643F
MSRSRALDGGSAISRMDGEGFDLDLDDLNAVPPFDSGNRINLHVGLEGQAVDIFGAVEVTESGVDVHVAGSMNSWSDAFDIHSLSLNIRPKRADL